MRATTQQLIQLWQASWSAAQRVHRQSLAVFDAWLIFAALGLLVIGWLMVSSASIAVAELRTGQLGFFAVRQALFILVSLGAALLVVSIPLGYSFRMGYLFLLAAFALLILVLLIGREVNGSTRWISLGPVNLQTSELAKICMVIYLSSYLVRHLQSVRQTLSGFAKPLLMVFLYGAFLFLQPDYGSLVVMTAAALAMVFLAGARLSYFTVMLVLVVLGLVLVALVEPYRVQRLISFRDPWLHQFDSGYQLTQALIAYGRGHWLGQGLGNSVQKLFYLPEAHTDFIFSVLSEELGLLGALTTLGLFVLLVSRVLIIGRLCEQQQQLFAAFVCYGIGILLGLQVVINLGVNLGLLPTKGLTLPLLSYGGSSLLSSGIMLGLVFRADLERRWQEAAKASPEQNRNSFVRS
ncbi:putative lipid II flippase FtsW [Marinospirillum sp. MEB164]|uniref:Probable peptidoglycan glycosyltransferase FtsW n=1 Tax=Marinospirillum alkalitolerans TaxID=3123374 RepID=A0ABW8PXA7_9GAMM